MIDRDEAMNKLTYENLCEAVELGVPGALEECLKRDRYAKDCADARWAEWERRGVMRPDDD